MATTANHPETFRRRAPRLRRAALLKERETRRSRARHRRKDPITTAETTIRLWPGPRTTPRTLGTGATSMVPTTTADASANRALPGQRSTVTETRANRGTSRAPCRTVHAPRRSTTSTTRRRRPSPTVLDQPVPTKSRGVVERPRPRPQTTTSCRRDRGRLSAPRRRRHGSAGPAVLKERGRRRARHGSPPSPAQGTGTTTTSRRTSPKGACQ